MIKIGVTAESSADPQRVLEAAGDFSARRAEMWSNPNAFAPGSTWELRVRPRNGGSEAEMILTRGFHQGPKGRIAAVVNHTVARFFWRPYLKGFLKKVEKSGA